MKPTTLVLPPLAVLTLLAPEALRADPSRTVEVEIVDTPSSGAAHVARYAISVVEDRGWFSTFMKDDATQLRLGARIDHPSSATAAAPRSSSRFVSQLTIPSWTLLDPYRGSSFPT